MQFIVLMFVFAFTLFYFIIEKIGYFSDSPLSNLEILYSVPMLSASIIFLIVASISFFKNLKRSGIKEWIKILSVLLIVSGLWLSYLTRFSGEIVLTEGQTFYSGHRDYIPETLYRGRFASVPEIALKLDELAPTVSKDKNDLKGLRGKFSLITTDSDRQRKVVITNGLPTILDNTFFRIKDMGYSPRYVLKSKDGKFLDSSFIFMKLFPPGSEDNFRLLSPLTYYVRYYPEGNDDNHEPLIGLRIVRNKDIVYNGTLTMTEDADFENSRISFEEIRRWTILSLCHDPGALLFIPGLILAFLYTIIEIIRRNKSSHEQI
jgi:hypothetical protein